MIIKIPEEFNDHTHFTFKEAAALLNRSVVTLYQWKKKGYIHVEYYSPISQFIPRAELENIFAGKNTFGRKK